MLGDKLLGQLGQAMPIPSTGWLQRGSHPLRDSLVLVLFIAAPCAPRVLLLLSAYTKSIFVVTSEIDTQAARASERSPATSAGVAQTSSAPAAAA